MNAGTHYSQNLELVDGTGEVSPATAIEQKKCLDDAGIEPQVDMQAKACHGHEN
jgi:hypothetical protein